jgi:hypothetical protein
MTSVFNTGSISDSRDLFLRLLRLLLGLSDSKRALNKALVVQRMRGGARGSVVDEAQCFKRGCSRPDEVN